MIASASRTPIGKFGGSLAHLTAADLGVIAVKAALKSASVAPEWVDETIIGHARQAGNGPNVARQVSYRSGIPESIAAYTVNKACGSGLKALLLATQEILLGNARIMVAGGTESMSRVPYLVDNGRWGLRMGNQPLTDGMYRDGFFCPLSQMVMGETAENLAVMHNISRDEQDDFAVRSQSRAAKAIQDGRFREEIVPVQLQGKKGEVRDFTLDEHVRADVSLADMKKLPPVFSKTGTVTAGNSSGITDGAAAVVLMSESEASRRNVKPLAKVVDYASAGVDPKIMGIAPVPAIRKLLAKTKLKIDDFGLIELNEAFAAQVIACMRELPMDPARLNVNGGAIALGHPIGCSGARIVTTLVHEMQKRATRYGLATLCISGGMGIALALERL